MKIVYVNCFAKLLRKLHIKTVWYNKNGAMRVSGPAGLAL